MVPKWVISLLATQRSATSWQRELSYALSPRRAIGCGGETDLENRSMRIAMGLLAALISLFGHPATAQLAPAPDGRAVAATCASCHGTNGASPSVIPSLAGRPAPELVTLMLEFKSGKRTGTVMPQLAKGYTDEQIDVAAVWFAAQPPANRSGAQSTAK
jgi:cytochrome subunit of sulfide dehydrogenase